MCSKMYKSRHGFTLVELLVVIGIIALLISILLPSLNRARESAKSLACASNMRQLGQAFHLYANENKGTLAPAMVMVSGDNWFKITWDDLLAKQLGVKWMTENDYMGPHPGNQNNPFTRTPEVLRCPNDELYNTYPAWVPAHAAGNRDIKRSYSMIAASYSPAGLQLSAGTGIEKEFTDRNWAGPESSWTKDKKILRLATVKGGQGVLLLVENFSGNMAGSAMGHAISRPVDMNPNFLRPAHGKHKNNFLFCDGHVEPLTIQETMTTYNPSSWPPNGAWTVRNDD